MAKPNYQFEKRQRELEKKKKKEEKLAKRSAAGGSREQVAQEPSEDAEASQPARPN
ncbi:MAG: hypothetical protein ING73_10115 [Rhodocyclaceae bacterium]|nr:hypothetical protein [Rhodocyclaceae bacterium]MCA3025516.1 hypothetical protein [Rhodocyclaceae bacterium]MCA3033356.1 hypothetical protein [Rhodocyclaceae bacterium]MCA3037948.1 hypothetical protein [Rhodocyclaceae bacterium]MCA3039299.1 hypothetical protein [Rhodocyclaceae bacterium]